MPEPEETTRSIAMPVPSPFGPGEVDPDADLEGVSADSTLDEIAQELAQEVEAEDEWVDVPGRPGYRASFDVHLDGDKLGKWRKASKDRSTLEGINAVALGLRVLANQNTAIERRGEIISTEGRPMTFRSQAFLALMGTGRPVDAVRKFFGLDGHVLGAMTQVLEAAGYGDELGEDPT